MANWRRQFYEVRYGPLPTDQKTAKLSRSRDAYRAWRTGPPGDRRRWRRPGIEEGSPEAGLPAGDPVG